MHSGQFFRGNDRHRRVHTHAARIGAAVAIECALVILCGGHAVSLAVADERKQRTLGTRQAFFDEHGGAGIAERAVEAGTNSILCGFQVVGNDNALARCQAVRLDNDGSAQFANVSERFVQVREAAVTSRRNTVGLHEFLAVGFAALQQGSLSIGSERSHARFAQNVRHAGDQRSFGADDNQVNRMLPHERQHGIRILGIQPGNVLSNGIGSAVARSYVQPIGARRLRQGPRDGIFATAAAQHQDVHIRSFHQPTRFT